MKKLKNILLYCGLTKEMYYKVRQRVSEENSKTISSFSLASAAIFALVAIISIFVVVSVTSIVYIIPAAFLIFVWFINKKLSKKFYLISDILAISFVILLLGAGVVVGIKQGNERTTLLLPFFVFASLTFSFRIIYLVSINVITEALFLLLISRIQTGELLVVNTTNTMIFCVIGTYTGIILMILKYRKLEADYHTKYLSEMDALTNVFNRRSYDQFIDQLKNDGITKKVGIAIYDIDFFKKYNDYYGHTKGDELLIAITKVVDDHIKNLKDTHLFRYGGEEFVVVVNNVEEESFKKLLIDINCLVYDLNIPRDDIGEYSRITVSVGGAIEAIPGITEDFITNADNQLYYGKNTKRNNVYFKNESLLTNTFIAREDAGVNNNYIMSQVLLDLASNANDIYSVDCKTKKVTVYRSGGKVLGISRVLRNDFDYASSFRAYIENNVHPLDREKVYKSIEFDNVYKAVKEYGVVNIYYRVLRDDVTSFFKIQFMPMGSDKNNFSSMVCAFLPEYIDLSREQDTSMLELDDLTNIYTRQAFYHYAKKYIDENPNKQFHILTSDIENFRFVNRIYGDAKADSVLRFLAKEFSNTENIKVVGRYSHDQFVMLVEDDEYLDNEGFRILIQTLKTKAPIPYLAVKYGVCAIDNIDEPIHAVCDKAIMALHDIKHREDYPIASYNDAIVLKQERIQMLEANFERALDNKEFEIYCQPKYKTTTKRIYGGEALLKWRTDKGEIISPGEFIPVFERSGVISRLDEYVFRFICEKQRALLDKGIVPYPISVNVSRNTLYMPSMLEKYIEIIESYGLDKRLVPIEITETWAIENYSILDFVQNIKKAGFMLHLDDFGTGYSSLSSLNMLPIDVVKLDKSLIDNIGTAKGNEILRHIIDLSHFLNMEVIAEGVEKNEQYEFLKTLNCEAIQGYYFSKAVSFDEYMKLIESDEAKN